MSNLAFGQPDEGLRRSFERARLANENARIEDYLPPPGDRCFLATLVELIAIELELAWKKYRLGDAAVPPPLLESYLARFQLRSDLDVLQRLVNAEVNARRHAGGAVDQAEYLRRFPELASCSSFTVHPWPPTMARNLAAVKRANRSRNLRHPAAPWAAGVEPIPGYRLVRLLGRGGMGEVWEALGPGGVPTALKRVSLLGECGQHELDALDVLKRVRHPHLLSIHGYWLVEDLLIIGSELADESLRSLLQRHQAGGFSGLALEETIRYLLDAAEALDYLGRPIHQIDGHAVRIQHRDVKPANLLVQGGAIKLADYGLAKVLEGMADETSMSMTLAYAPPEFFHGQVTPYSDQYSLGVTYLELRTGRLPFAGSPAEVMRAHLQAEPDLNGLTPAERDIVARALAKNPKQRWASCVKFIGEIDRADHDWLGAADALERPAAIASPPGDIAPTVNYRQAPVASGRLLIEEDLVPLPLRGTRVHALITAGYADVRVQQKFVNEYARPVEARYAFPLPPNAAVYRLRLHVGERLIEGAVERTDDAREMYDEARQAGHGAASIEELTPGALTVSMANILPDQEVCVELNYVQPVDFRDDQYHFVFPLVIPLDEVGSQTSRASVEMTGVGALSSLRLPAHFVRGDTISITVDIDTGVPLCGFDSPTHDLIVQQEVGASRAVVTLRSDRALPNRDFALNYRVSGQQLEHQLFCQPATGDDPGTFLLFITPPRSAARVHSTPTVPPTSGRAPEPNSANQALTQIELQWTGATVAEVLPETIPDVEVGRPLMILGRYQGAELPRLTVGGRCGAGSFSAELAPQVLAAGERNLLALIWARIKIVRLIDQISSSPAAAAELREQVIRLALKYGLACPWTALLAVEYRSKTERQRGRQAVLVHIPPYAPREVPAGEDPQPAATDAAPPARPVGPKETIHAKLGRIRAPRSQIVFEQETESVLSMRQLPFVVGVLGDFAGHGARRPLSERRFIPIDRDSFDQVLRELGTCLQYRVPDFLGTDGGEIEVNLKIERMADFAPERVIAQVSPFPELLRMRGTLIGLMLANASPDNNLRAQLEALDATMSRQLTIIMHHQAFQTLERAWRGLHFLVQQSETSSLLNIKLLDCTKNELKADQPSGVAGAMRAVERLLFAELHRTDGTPFGVMVVSDEFDDSPDDAMLLTRLADLGARTFCPFLTGKIPVLSDGDPSVTPALVASPQPPSGSRPELSLETSSTAPYLVTTTPCHLSRLAYGAETTPVAAFDFREGSFDERGRPVVAAPAQACWMNSAYLLANRLGEAFSRHGLCVRWNITPVADTSTGDLDKIIRDSDQLTAVLLTSRFVHGISCMLHQPRMRPLTSSQVATSLTQWLGGFVAPDKMASDATRLRFPLVSARVTIHDEPDRREVTVWLRPHAWTDPGSDTEERCLVITVRDS